MLKRTILFPVLIALLVVFATRHVWAAGDVFVIEANGVVSPGMAAYFERVIGEANEQDADAVLVVLDTPGGIVGSTTDIIKIMRGSDVPVIVYVGPPGAQAGSAGALITMAGHASAMAPETAIGAASPINGDGQDIESTAYNKLVEFLTAEVRSLTESRPQEAQDLGEAMITDARAVSASEALAVGLIDVIADNQNEVLAQLDGREVVVGGEVVVLSTLGGGVISAESTLLEQFQMFLVNNTELLGLLLPLGFMALVIELRAPGGYIGGGIGIICLAVAWYGMGLLPTNYFGVGLIVLALILFILETQTPTFGILTMIGTVSLVGGLMTLFNTEDAPALVRISLLSALGIALPLVVTFAWLGVAIARIMHAQPLSGKEGMIGTKGVVRKQFKPFGDGYRGTVFVMGELWTAESADPLPSEWPVRIESVDGLTVHVVGTASAALPSYVE